MNQFNKIFFDFDGVILDSHPIREAGFQFIFDEFPSDNVDTLIEYHRDNGGLSRYHKIDYFYDHIAETEASLDIRKQKASQFSEFMRSNLTDKKFLIDEVVSFIHKNYTRYDMHVISGSDQNELRFLCASLGLDHYFHSILGSPTPKDILIGQALKENNYVTGDVVYIGDAKNDYDASTLHNVAFLGYNNEKLKKLGVGYLEKFDSVIEFIA